MNTQKSHFVGIIIKVIALTTPMTTVAALGQTTASIAIGMGLLALARTLRTKAFVSCSSRDHA
ncbi:MAG: hypothetical protein KUG75_00290 [Pseudomonadales bacterium]|nr:hypothetical protein [Pseudomonadales bacterium]